MLLKLPLHYLSLVAAPGAAQAACTTEPPTVQLGKTTLTGAAYLNSTVEFFGAIPYAQPPLGHLRFKPPVLQTSLSVPSFDATNFGAACLQPGVNSSEDCLTVNVFRPAGVKKGANLPVMFWIHGGGYKTGASSESNATALVAQSISRGTPVVYVSMNYRLATLGFPQGNEAQAEGALNLALKDQLTALKWVQANVELFGGDKSKVTIFGESAGAGAAATLYMNNNLKGLARAAIMQSGTASLTPVYAPARRQADWDNFVKAIPACAAEPSAAFRCLQTGNVSTADLLNAVLVAEAEADEDYPWVPTLDGPHGLLPDIPSALLAEGKFTRIPIISGTNLDEGTFFATPRTNSTAMIQAYMISNYSHPEVSSNTLGQVVDKILQFYPNDPALGSPYNTGNQTFGLDAQWKRYSAILGDVMFQGPRRQITQAVSSFGVEVFGYLFTDPGAQPLVPPFFVGNPTVPNYLGVTHTSDVPYIYKFTAFVHDTTAAATLATVMVDYWLSFVTSLNPNDGHGPIWKQYDTKDAMILELNNANTSMIPDNYREASIAFISSNSKVFGY